MTPPSKSLATSTSTTRRKTATLLTCIQLCGSGNTAQESTRLAWRNHRQLQTLYAKIVNTGASGAHVRVNLTIYSATTDKVCLLSNELLIEPGGRVTVSAEFAPTIAGTFYVKGVLQFSFDGVEWALYFEVQEALLRKSFKGPIH